MMLRTPKPPEGHGERVVKPALHTWHELMRENASAIETWEFVVGGRDARELRAEARVVLLARAREYTASLGVPIGEDPADPEFVVVTGHQPELFHPGVWAKYLAMQEVVSGTGAAGLDVVVDSDTYSSLSATLPCLGEELARCGHALSVSSAERTYAGAPVPSASTIERFCSDALRSLDPLAAPDVRRNMERYCGILRDVGPGSEDLAGFVTAARRRYEGSRSDYLELAVTRFATSEPYLTFVADILCDAARFATEFNTELAEYRSTRRIRSAAQPFPDLEVGDDRVEVPFWIIDAGRRQRVFVRHDGAGIRLFTDSAARVLPCDPEALVAALRDDGAIVAPRAVSLTLFVRAFLADLFIHGLGGARYDRITEGVAARYWGVSLPPHASVSLTMHLPLTANAPDPARLADLERTLGRLAHNPDEFLGNGVFIDPSDAARAERLRSEKHDLVDHIGRPGADKRSLGMRIKEVNDEITKMIEPFASALRAERDALSREVETASVLADRTYPYFLWTPEDVAEMLL